MDNARKRQVGFSIGYVLAGLLLVWAAQSTWTSMQATRFRPLPYSEFLQLVDGDKVREVQLRYDTILAELKEGDRVVVGRLPGVDETSLLKELRDHHVVFSGRVERDPWWRDLVFGWLLPLGLLAPFWLFGVRRVGKAGGPLSIGGSRAKIYDATEKERVTFADVAGVDEAKAELSEVVDFLKSPHKYAALGARIPKGVLLVGAPGTGKTLLAKAVAGEAGVPFFSISGSEFIEMFVGVGAARVRDLFEQAKSRAPCIVFIDELDAIGKSRGGIGAMAIHDEREQTLNQLLVEMDGFDARTGVIIMAATNRPEVLDAALLRAGRFDRQVAVDRPDVREREAILRVHAKKLVLGGDVDLALVARATPAMVGADLANVVNEAALAAARRNAEAVDARDFDEAVDRVQLGLKRRRRAMTEEEKRRVAYHEAGHTIVALTVPHADPVHRVTIIPRSIGALGATLQLPASERYLMTRDELCDRICVMMGGRAAEELAFGNVSTGAQNDLERATETARQMVCRFGMSTRLGAQTFGRPAGLRFLETPVAFGEERNFSEATAREIDGEVRRILDDERERAREIVEARRPLLEAIAERLLEKETIERVELEELVRAAGEERVAMH